MQKTINHINQRVADTLGLEVEEIHPDDDLRQDLNATELELADLMTLLEQEFGIEMTLEEARQLSTISDLHELILDKLNEVA